MLPPTCNPSNLTLLSSPLNSSQVKAAGFTAGQFGTSAPYYNDYRYQRRPDEEMSLGRTFHLREQMSLQIRVEFFNIFNRTEINNPTVTNALATQVVKNGLTASGFGYINTGSVAFGPRSGQLVAQFHW